MILWKIMKNFQKKKNLIDFQNFGSFFFKGVSVFLFLMKS